MNIDTLLDHHMHSAFSEDSEELMEVLVTDAIALGKTHITCTEHSELIFQHTTGSFCADITAYDNHVVELQAKFPQIKILRGAEIGFEKSILSDIATFMTTHKFNITIISIHTLFGGLDIADEFRTKNVWEHSGDVLYDYYIATLDAVTLLPHFDILGHLDYITRYIPDGATITLQPYRDIIAAIFEQTIKKNIALDMNTAGWRYGLPYAHPQSYLLDLYKDLGGKYITLGSDAHRAQDVNFGFNKAIRRLEQTGFTALTTLENGYPEQIPFTFLK